MQPLPLSRSLALQHFTGNSALVMCRGHANIRFKLSKATMRSPKIAPWAVRLSYLVQHSAFPLLHSAHQARYSLDLL